jgi:hypothetical protein
MNRNISFFSVGVKPAISVDSTNYIILLKIKNVNICKSGVTAEYKNIFGIL